MDTVKASRHKNMKDLRPGSTGRSEVRVLFAFDLERKAILLVGGDKSSDWTGWYDKNIPIGDDRFDEHQASVWMKAAKKQSSAKQAKSPQTRGRKQR